VVSDPTRISQTHRSKANVADSGSDGEVPLKEKVATSTSSKSSTYLPNDSIIPDEGPLLKASDLIVSFRQSVELLLLFDGYIPLSPGKYLCCIFMETYPSPQEDLPDISYCTSVCV
jgi:hypothetical protein